MASDAKSTSTSSPQSASSADEAVVLSPFTVSTDKDKGYAATNAMSGSRVNTPIKDLPIPVQVITSDFINDIGATDLRQSLSYVAGIELNSQNDLDNVGGTFGSPYGPGGVNNPAGVTSNVNQVQLKIRGFITNNTLRDGFLRGNGTDAVNIDRIEVVEGPNALLYGTGNFGGVVDYLTKQPLDQQQGVATFGIGTYSFMRTTIDMTGPISTANHIDYRISGAWEGSKTNIQYQKNSHYFLSPSFTWKPTPKTELTVEGELGKSTQHGYSFQALRAVAGNGATPVNNDQLEAVSFYFPPGANPRTFNLSGPDTHNDQRANNLEVKLTQNILKESDFAPQVDFLIGYNHSAWGTDEQNLAGEIVGPRNPGDPGYSLSQTIVTDVGSNGLGGQVVDNGNLTFGTLPHSVVEYSWSQAQGYTWRDQERAEFVLRKALFHDKWYELEEQVLAGWSAILNVTSANSAATQSAAATYNYKSPLDLSPIVYGHWGDGTADTKIYPNGGSLNKAWDSAFYANSYLKFLSFGGVSDRIIIMNGIRRDRADNWSQGTQFSAPDSAGHQTLTNIGPARAPQFTDTTNQNGVSIKLTKNLSVYGLRAQGFQPNFGTQHDAATGLPVGPNIARSNEWGLKFDLFDGKLSGTISNYKITKKAWTGAPWFSPAPLGHVRFDPSKPIVYNIEYGGFMGVTGQPPIQQLPSVVSAWNAAVAAGAVTSLSPITHQQNNPDAVYLNVSIPQAAAYMDEVFKQVQLNGGAWPGWLYMGNSFGDPNINNATMDAAGFQNGPENAAYQTVDEAKGWDGSILFTPNKSFQFLLTASINSTVRQVKAAQWAKYPYPQDRWAVWYFPNGSWGLQGSPIDKVYGNWQDTSTHQDTLFPGDDTPKNSLGGFMKYNFDEHGSLKGLSIGVGGNWHSEQVIFSGITHGSGQAETSNGKLLILTAPSRYLINAFASYDWKNGEHEQYVQLNVDNVLDDTKRYGLVYQTPMTAKLTYGIKF